MMHATVYVRLTRYWAGCGLPVMEVLRLGGPPVCDLDVLHSNNGGSIGSGHGNGRKRTRTASHSKSIPDQFGQKSTTGKTNHQSMHLSPVVNLYLLSNRGEPRSDSARSKLH